MESLPLFEIEAERVNTHFLELRGFSIYRLSVSVKLVDEGEVVSEIHFYCPLESYQRIRQRVKEFGLPHFEFYSEEFNTEMLYLAKMNLTFFKPGPNLYATVTKLEDIP